MNAHLREDYFFVSLLWGGGADCMKWTDLKTVQFYSERWDFLRSVLSTSRCSVHFNFSVYRFVYSDNHVSYLSEDESVLIFLSCS